MVILQIWDTAGQERYQSLSSSFYRGADCCLIVYDLTNPASFANVLGWRDVFLTKSDPLEPETLPFLVMGNKLDEAELHRKVTTLEGKKLCHDLGGNLLFFETSAKDNLNLEAAMLEIVKRVVKRQEALKARNLEGVQTASGAARH